MQKPETRIVQEIIAWIKAHGGDAYHVHGSQFQRKGEPDIDGWLPTDKGILHLKVEVKTGIGKATPLQLYRLEKYRAAGYVAGVVRSLEEFRVLTGT